MVFQMVCHSYTLVLGRSMSAVSSSSSSLGGGDGLSDTRKPAKVGLIGNHLSQKVCRTTLIPKGKS